MKKEQSLKINYLQNNNHYFQKRTLMDRIKKSQNNPKMNNRLEI